jgi:hypothetical protein
MCGSFIPFFHHSNCERSEQLDEGGRRNGCEEAIITLDKAAAIQIAEQASSEMGASELVDLIEGGFKAGIMVVGDLLRNWST